MASDVNLVFFKISATGTRMSVITMAEGRDRRTRFT
jgi:hypothetical protein